MLFDVGGKGEEVRIWNNSLVTYIVNAKAE